VVSCLAAPGFGNAYVLGYPAIGEMISILDLTALVIYLDSEGMFIFREQGTSARCRAVTPYHADPLFEPRIEGDPLFEVDKIWGPLAFRPYGVMGVTALQLTGTFQFHREGKRPPERRQHTGRTISPGTGSSRARRPMETWDPSLVPWRRI
jgi:hypothetical protein